MIRSHSFSMEGRGSFDLFSLVSLRDITYLGVINGLDRYAVDVCTWQLKYSFPNPVVNAYQRDAGVPVVRLGDISLLSHGRFAERIYVAAKNGTISPIIAVPSDVSKSSPNTPDPLPNFGFGFTDAIEISANELRWDLVPGNNAVATVYYQKSVIEGQFVFYFA